MAIPASGIDGVAWETSVDADMLSVSISSSGSAATSLRFELFFAFLDCLCFFVICVPSTERAKNMRVEESTGNFGGRSLKLGRGGESQGGKLTALSRRRCGWDEI